jgi:hypothetical protein
MAIFAPKILCCGFHKTATSSMHSALEMLGFSVQGYDERLLRLWASGERDAVWDSMWADAYRDWPWALIWREFDRRFPGTKFILTLRSTASWFSSLERHAARTGPTWARHHIYGYSMPGDDPGHHMQVYETHNAAVIGYFRGRDDLLVFDAESGHGWTELGDFLDAPVPDEEFPHEYRTSE